MEKESFEDEEVAELLNKSFVSIKVDREERPDLDSIYMDVCQVMTGHGGWPLTIVMTPDKKPFFAATYLPKQSRSSILGLIDILTRITELWEHNKNELLETGEKITDYIRRDVDREANFNVNLNEQIIEKCFNLLEKNFDSKYGGFGVPPKFPSPHNLYFLLRYYVHSGNNDALNIVECTLRNMYNGGIYDHIGFGFARYSTDREWLVPHFEKMLYDNALLAIAYLETYQVTKKEFYARVAREIFTYVLRDMTSDEGAFYSAEDADSEGVEGKYYVWTPNEIISILGERDGQYFCDLYNITPSGNFEGKSIPNLIDRGITEEERQKVNNLIIKLFYHRNNRIRPHKDDKILTSWNGLMIAALAYGARVLDDTRYLEASKKAVNFIITNLCRNDGRLLARYRDGEALYLAYAADYAFFTWGLIELYRASNEIKYLEMAVKLTDDLVKYFWDDCYGGLYLYGSDSEQLLTRPKESYDGAIPSDNSVAALNFMRLYRLTGRSDLEEKADKILHLFSSKLNEIPAGHTYMLLSLLYSISSGKDIVIAGTKDNTKDMIQITNKIYLPFTEVVVKDENNMVESVIPFIKDIKIDDKAMAYVCQQSSCLGAISDIEEFSKVLLT